MPRCIIRVICCHEQPLWPPHAARALSVGRAHAGRRPIACTSKRSRLQPYNSNVVLARMMSLSFWQGLQIHRSAEILKVRSGAMRTAGALTDRCNTARSVRAANRSVTSSLRSMWARAWRSCGCGISIGEMLGRPDRSVVAACRSVTRTDRSAARAADGER